MVFVIVFRAVAGYRNADFLREQAAFFRVTLSFKIRRAPPFVLHGKPIADAVPGVADTGNKFRLPSEDCRKTRIGSSAEYNTDGVRRRRYSHVRFPT